MSALVAPSSFCQVVFAELGRFALELLIEANGQLENKLDQTLNLVRLLYESESYYKKRLSELKKLRESDIVINSLLARIQKNTNRT